MPKTLVKLIPIFVLMSSFSLFGKGNILLQHVEVHRTSGGFFEAIHNLYDDTELTVEIRKYPDIFARNHYRLIAKMSLNLNKKEMASLIPHIIHLAQAETEKTNRNKVCTVLPNDPTSRILAVVRDFDEKTRRFYKPLEVIENDAKCWNAEVITFKDDEDHDVAETLRKIINKISRLMTVYHIPPA